MSKDEKPHVGRPAIEITPDIIKKAELFAAQGMTKEQIAAALGMGQSTMFEKFKAYPEFLEAIKSGQAKGIATITNSLFANAKGGNTTAQIFYLKNRAAWADKSEVENTHTFAPTISEKDAGTL